MTLKNIVTTIAVGATLVLLACTGQVEPTSGQTDCPAGQRFLNGQCVSSCATNADCTGGASCLLVEMGGGAAVCVVPSGPNPCTYLGSDDKCVGVGTYYGGRGGALLTYSSDPPGADSSNTTSFADPYFQASGPYDAYSYNPNDGCEGDAQWQMVPATTNPGCGVAHTVHRCRLLGSNECVLVEGTTVDRPNL